ncbi:hypothetical protein [Citrobacter youngae]|uniref:Uncharacterized protein n=1 Tax=Citrobacter youngae ATCC 29220 TaxID=500640 RepID=D4B8F4_9ENTR|nr:hypothetical protein [Citrobacter youngae]EFE10326.1 hypothetical protein CIT292_06496 [Citrobacter youngae ATCC 29220]
MAKKLMVILFTHAIFTGKAINIHGVNLIGESIGYIRLLTFHPEIDNFPTKNGLSVLTLFLNSISFSPATKIPIKNA